MHTQKHTIFKVLVIIFFLAILVVNSKSIANSFRTNFMDASSVPLKSARAVTSAFKKIIPFASLREENKILRERINLLNRNLEEAKGIYIENNRLKGLMDFKKSIIYRTIPAQVIGRDPTNWSNSIIIDKGLADLIKEDKAVISTKGLVGRIVELGRHSAKILLITDPNSKVGVVIQRNAQGGILIGRPDGTCKMVYISLDSDVTAGDKVITAGFGTVFPKDILVGEVVKVDKEPGRLYKYAIVKTSQNLSRLEEVLCIR